MGSLHRNLSNKQLSEEGKKMESIKDKISKLESEIYSLRHLERQNEEMSNVIDDIIFLKNECGSMWLCGKSGKFDEPKYTVQIKINSFGGCVAIPDLAMSLAIIKNEFLSKEEN